MTVGSYQLILLDVELGDCILAGEGGVGIAITLNFSGRIEWLF